MLGLAKCALQYFSGKGDLQAIEALNALEQIEFAQTLLYGSHSV
jgi:hypothetical protein